MLLFFSRGTLSKEDHLSCRCCQAVQLHWFNGLLLQKWDTFTNTSSLLSSTVLALPSVTSVQPTNSAENWSKPKSSATSASWSTYQEAREAPWWLKTRQKPSFPVTTSWEISSSSLSWVHQIKTVTPSQEKKYQCWYSLVSVHLTLITLTW